MTLARQHVPIKQIVRRTGHSRKFVRDILRGERADVFRTGQSSIDARLPFLVQARALIDRFHTMIRRRAEAELDPWITEARVSLLASFATGISNDKAAVRAAITEPWSNGQTEGQITRLKLIKRQMYGRAKIDLLQA